MKDLLTHIPPTLQRTDGELTITIAFEFEGEAYSVTAPMGDGRYHAQRVHDLIISPALGWRPNDPPRTPHA